MRRDPPASPMFSVARLLCEVALVLAAAGAGPAVGADRDQPINLEADRVTIDDARQVAVFEGNVTLRQGSLQLRGQRMEVRQDKAGFSSGTTWGNPAYFRQQREGTDEIIEGWARRIEYDSRKQTMQMFDDARLKRGEDEVRGNFISYDGRAEFFQATGRPKPGAEGSADARVRAVIQPKPRQKPASPPLQLKPSEELTPRDQPAARQ